MAADPGGLLAPTVRRPPIQRHGSFVGRWASGHILSCWGLMQYNCAQYDLGQLKRGSTVIVTLRGNAANLRRYQQIVEGSRSHRREIGQIYA